MGLLSDFELIFERFEILASLAYFEKEDKDAVHFSLANNPHDAIWMPVGRSAWHSSYAARIIAEFEAEPLKTLLVQSGFAQKDPVFLGLYFKNFKALAARIHW